MAILPARSSRDYVSTVTRRLDRSGPGAFPQLRPPFEQTLKDVFQLKKGDTAILAISDVFPVRLIHNGRHMGKFEESLRFDVIIHFVAPFVNFLLLASKAGKRDEKYHACNPNDS
jgi:hypothetical protein